MLIVSLHFLVFSYIKNDVTNFSLDKEMNDAGIIWYLFAGLKPIILCSAHSI